MVKPLQKKATRCKSPASNQGGPKTVEVYKHFEPSKTNLFSRKPYRYKEFDFPTVIPPEVEVANVDYRGLKQQEGRSLENSFKDATLHERTRSNRNQKLKSITDTNLTVSNALRLMENRIKANMENLKKRESLINPKLGKSDMKSKNLNVKNDGIRRPLNLNTKFNQDGDAGNISGGQPFINKGKDVAKIGKTASGLLYDVDEFIHLNSAHRLYRDYMYNNWGTEEEEEVPKKSLSASLSEAQRSSQLRSSVVSTCQNANKKRTVNQDGRRENNEGSNADIGNEYSVIFEEPDTLPLQKQIDRDLAQSVSNTQLVYKKLTAEDKRTNSVSPRMKMNEEDMKTRLKELKLELCENRCNKLQDCTSETTSRRINLRGEANQGLQGKENNLRTPLTSQKVKEAECKTSVLKKNLEPVQTHCETTSDQFNKGQTSTSSTSKDKVKQELERIEKNSCKTLTSQKVKETETDLIEKVSCKTSTRESKSSIEIKSDSLQSNDANKVIHSGFARTSSTNTCLLLPDVVALRNELDTTKQTCHEEIRKSVKELRSEIAQYRQALNINVNIVSGKLLPESVSGVSSPEETTRSHVEDDILKTKKTEDEHEPTDSTGRTRPIHNFSDSDVHDESSRIKRTRSNLFEVDRSVKKSQSELMISPNTEFSEQFKHEDHLPKNNREEIAYNSTEIDKPELVNYQETLEMSVLRTKKSATRQQLSKQSTKLEPKKNLSKPPECEEVKTDNKVRGGVTLPVSVNGISFPCKEIDKCGDELTTNLQNMLDVLKLSLQLQSQIDENKRFHNTPSYDLQNIADFDEVICNLNGLIKSVELEHEVTETDISGKLTSKVVDCGINTKNVAELKSSEDNQENQGKTSDASCCENMRNHMNMLMQVLQQSKEDHRNEMKKTAEIIRQEFGHYKQQVVAYNMESSQKGSKCGKLNTKKLRERSCCLAPGTTCAAAPRTESPVPEKKVRLSLDLPDSDQKKGKCGCKGTFVEICACREKADKTSGKHREKNEDEKRCHLFGCANPTISVQQDEKKPEPDKASRKQSKGDLKQEAPRLNEDGILEQNQKHLTKIDHLIKQIQESVDTLKIAYDQASKNLETIELNKKVCKCKQDLSTIPMENQVPAVNSEVACSCNRFPNSDSAKTNSSWCSLCCRCSNEISDPSKTIKESTSAQSDVINLKPKPDIFESMSTSNCDETDYTLFSIQSLEPSSSEIYKESGQDSKHEEKLEDLTLKTIYFKPNIKCKCSETETSENTSKTPSKSGKTFPSPFRSSKKEQSYDSRESSKSGKPKIKTSESASKSSTKSARSPNRKREASSRVKHTRPKPGAILKKPKKEFRSKPPLKLAVGDSKSKTSSNDRSKSKGSSTSKKSVYSGRGSTRGSNTPTRFTSSTKNSQSSSLPTAMKIGDKETQKNIYVESEQMKYSDYTPMIEKEEIEVGAQSLTASSHHTETVGNKVQMEEGVSFNNVPQLIVTSKISLCGILKSNTVKAQFVDEDETKKSEIKRDSQTSLCEGVECDGFCFAHRKAPISSPNDSVDIIYLKEEIKIKRKHSNRSQINRSRVEAIGQGNDNLEETNSDTTSTNGLMSNKGTEPPVDEVKHVSINQKESNTDKCFGKCSFFKKPQLKKSSNTTQTFIESKADGVTSVSHFPQTSTQTSNTVQKSSSITCPNTIKNGSVLDVDCQCKSIKISQSEKISQGFTPSAKENKSNNTVRPEVIEMTSQTSKSLRASLTLKISRQIQVLEDKKPTTNITQEISVEESIAEGHDKDQHKIETKICNGTTQTRIPIIIPGENKVLEFYSYPDSSQSISKSISHNTLTCNDGNSKANSENKKNDGSSKNKEILKSDTKIESDFFEENVEDVATDAESASLENLSASPKYVPETDVTDQFWDPDYSQRGNQEQMAQQNVLEDFEVNRKRSSSSYCRFKKSKQNKPGSKRSEKPTGSHFVDSQRLIATDEYICTEACPYVRELRDTGTSPVLSDGITDRNLPDENVYSSKDIPSARLILTRPQSRFGSEQVNARLENTSDSTSKSKLQPMNEKYFELPEDESNMSRQNYKCLCSVSEMARSSTKQQLQSSSVSRSTFLSEKELKKMDLYDSNNMYCGNKSPRKRTRCESLTLDYFSADQIRCCDHDGNAKLIRSVRHFQGISTVSARNARPPEILFANELHQNTQIVRRTRNYENWVTYYLSPL